MDTTRGLTLHIDIDYNRAMPRKILLFLTVAGIVLSLSCTGKNNMLENKYTRYLDKILIEVFYPKDWTVEHIEGTTIHNGRIRIYNNKPAYTGDRIDFSIGTNVDNIKDIDVNEFGYEQIKNGNIEFEFYKSEHVWFDDKFISAKIGIINIDGQAFFDLKFEYLPEDKLQHQVKAILENIVFVY